MNPRYLYSLTISKGSLLTVKIKFVEERFKTITLHFDVLNSIPFSSAHSQQILISDCNFSGESLINTISSANPKLEIIRFSIAAPKLELFNFSKRSLMNIKNKIGPSLLPCKTPERISNSGDKFSPIKTLALLLEYISFITLNSFPRTPQLYNFEIKSPLIPYQKLF